MPKNLISGLNKPVSPAGLAIFRILFGVIMLWDIIRFYRLDLIDTYFRGGVIFPYPFLSLPVASEGTLKLLLAGLAVSAVLITAGYFYRLAMTYFAVVFTYFFFLNEILYNNHLYLICMISFMMIFMPADAALSLDKKRHSDKIPRWSYRVLQLQLVIVYFFGGVAKLNPYWFDMHPVVEFLAARAQKTEWYFLRADATAYFFTYFGIIFDLLIGFLLWMRKTRIMAVVLAVLFNLINSFLFEDIFIFPFFMIGALVLFISPKAVERQLAIWGWNINQVPAGAALPRTLGNLGFAVLALHFTIQFFLPLRHYFMPGYVDWTGEGQQFAWRMKIQHRTINEVKFAVFDTDEKAIHGVDLEQHLYPDEVVIMCQSPRMIVQFAKYLEKEARTNNGVQNCWVKCKVNVSFNGLPPVDIFDPEQDLLVIAKRNRSYNEWVNPLPAH